MTQANPNLVTTKNIIEAVAEKRQVTKALARDIINEAFALMTEELAQGKKVRLNGFGIFSSVRRGETKSINPSTRQEIILPERNIVRFTVSKVLKAAVNK